MDTLRGVESFVRAVDSGSIAGAARLLNISAAAASQNIARLEKSLGVRLLTRTTRSLALTDAGEVYYQRVKGLIQELTLAEQAVSAIHGKVAGKLKVACSAAFARYVLAPVIPAFMAKYPGVTIEIVATDRRTDHIQEGIDVSIRINQQVEEGLVAHKLATVPFMFCAAPAYLAKHGCPESAQALRQHDSLVFRIPVEGRVLPWVFIRDGQRYEPEIRAALISDDIDILARIAAEGGGIARLAEFVAKPYVEQGLLKQLFNADLAPGVEDAAAPLTFYFCVADRFSRTPKVEAFYRFLEDSLPKDWQ